MSFVPHSQAELQNFNIIAGQSYRVQYQNKDYYNGEETIEEAHGTAMITDGNIYFNVTDPYGMDKLVMKVRIVEK